MLTHKGTKIIETQRLVLRRFTYKDAEPMFDTWANDERVTKFLTWTPHGEVSLTKQLICHWCWLYEKENNYNWCIEFEGKPIGNISVVRTDENSEHMDLGYCIGYDFWNCGFVTEAASAVVDYLFTEIGANRISIWHAVKNPASGKVAKKCGMSFEGIYRQYYKASDGEYLDISVWSILRSEYKPNRKL